MTTRKRLTLSAGSLSVALDQSVADELHLTEGAEVEMHVEDGRIVIEPVRAKPLEPVSDVGARAERRKQTASALDEVMRDHRELFAQLAK